GNAYATNKQAILPPPSAPSNYVGRNAPTPVSNTTNKSLYTGNHRGPGSSLAASKKPASKNSKHGGRSGSYGTHTPVLKGFLGHKAAVNQGRQGRKQKPLQGQPFVEEQKGRFDFVGAAQGGAKGRAAPFHLSGPPSKASRREGARGPGTQAAETISTLETRPQ
ncbi:hypothetical protein TeGR_g8611, partial [Tetraparma gracilis]